MNMCDELSLDAHLPHKMLGNTEAPVFLTLGKGEHREKADFWGWLDSQSNQSLKFRFSERFHLRRWRVTEK